MLPASLSQAEWTPCRSGLNVGLAVAVGSGVDVGVGVGVGGSGVGVSVGMGLGVRVRAGAGRGVSVGVGVGACVGGGIYTCVGVGDAGVGEKGTSKNSLEVSVGRRTVGLDVGLAVGVAVEEGVAVGVWVWVGVIVTVTVGVAVAVGAFPALIPSTTRTTVTRDMMATAAIATQIRRSIRRLAVPIQGSNMVAAGGFTSIPVPPSEDAGLSAFILDRGESNSASCISATF